MKIRELLTFLLLALITDAYGASLRFKHIEATDGLSDNKINTILKDRNGFVWIATVSGLNRYDGYNIKIYRNDPADSTSITDNYVDDIVQGADGRLWVNAGSRYIMYDPETDTFDNHPERLLATYGIKGQPTKIVADNKGEWIYVREEGLFRHAGAKTMKLEGIASGNREVTDICPLNDSIHTAIIDNFGAITIIDTAGKVTRRDETIVSAAKGATQFWLFADREGLLWVYGNTGVRVKDPHSGGWIHPPLPEGIQGATIRAIAQDDTGRTWIGLDNEGVAVIDKSGGVMRLVNNPNDIYSLGNNSVTSLLADNKGTMWVGTQKKGVSVYNDSEFKFDLEAMPDVNCVVEASQPGQYWIGTDTNGLMLWDRKTGSLTPVNDPTEGTRPHAIATILKARDGSLWIGTFNNGLVHYTNGRFIHYNSADGLPNNNVWAIIENNDGTLWTGTLGGGLALMNPSTRTSVTYNTENSELPSDYVMTMNRGGDGKLYIGTSNGLATLDPVTNKIVAVNGTRDNGTQLEKRAIGQLFTDSRGLLWIGTRDGLCVYDLKHDRIYEVPLLPDLSRPFILGMTEDSARNLWIGVDGSIINVTVAPDINNSGYSFTPHVYSGKDGLQNSTFNQRSMAMLDNGDIVVGGLYGLNRVSPGSIRYNLSRPKVIFTDLVLQGGEPVKPGKEYDGHVILTKTLNHTSKVTLTYRQNSFNIYFATDNYILPEHTTYYYKLEGFRDEWLECPAGMHHVTYTNLSPGNYRLLIKAVNSDGVEGDSERSLDIVITPPIWATVWAKIIYVILAIALVTLLFIGLKHHEHKRYIKRQQEESARKQEELNQMKFKFYTNVSHELRTPLTLILSPLESMMRDNNDERTAKRLNTMHANASRLLYLVNQLLDFRKNEVAGLTFNGSTGDVISFLRSAFNSFADEAEKRGIDMEFHANAERLEMLFDADKLGKVIVNLLSNAMKFTPSGGKIDVDIQVVGQMLRIRVIDTGCGVPDDEKTHVFERFYQGANNKGGESGSGIGLSLVKDNIRLHEGDVWVQDTPGGGATFSIDIPVKTGVAAQATSIPQPDTEQLPASTGTDAASQHPTALLVDDNHDLLEFMRDELSPEFNILTASDGTEALKTLAERKVDIIVTDLMMPRMDGIELCRRLKTDPKTINIPVIVVTAKQDVRSVVEGLTVGADDYVTKPFNNEVLRLRMKRLVDLRRKGATRTPLMPDPEQVKITSLDEKLIERAVKYVEDNISRSDLSVEELSKALGMSRVHLYKKILHITGKTPIEFIRILRLKRATQYLRESQLNVSEIAYQLGFNNPKYFSKYFQEEFGISPSEYQKREGI